jgi:hypothetical protein
MTEDLEQRRRELVEQLALVSSELSSAREEIRALRGAIKTHREQTGHNLCWLNDVKLWEVLGDGKTTYPHDTLPSEEEFKMGCAAFYASRKKECDAEQGGCCGGVCKR